MPLPIPPGVPPVEPAPTRTGSFRSGGLTLTYEVHGERGPLMVFHPGVGFTRIYFRPLAGLLKGTFRCALLDPRGVAASERPARDEEYDLPYLAEDLAAFVDHLGENRAWLYGHSLGANVCLEAAVRYPEIAAHLVLSSFAAATDLVKPFVRFVRSSATPRQAEILDRYEAQGPVLSDDGVPPEYGQAAGEVWNSHVLRGAPSRSILWNMGQYEGPAAALWGKESAIFVTGLMAKIDQRPQLRQVRCPVTLLYGRYDQYASSSVPLSRAHVPELSAHELAESNHHSHVEEPGRIADVLIAKSGARPEGAIALRSDVELRPAGDSFVLEDTFTERKLELDEVEARIVRCFGVAEDELVARVMSELGEDYDHEQVREAVLSFVGSLSAMAMLAENLDGAEIARRQLEVTREGFEALRLEKLKAALAHAAEKVAFHRERFLAADVTVESAATREGLEKLPPMTKADIRANFPDRLIPDGVDVRALVERGDLSIGTTSGSTDERLQVLFDYKIGRLPEAYNRLWRIDPTVDLVKGAVFTSPVCAGFECHLGKLTMEERTRETTLTLNSCDDPMAITDDEVRAIVEELNAFEPDVLFTNPWYAVCLLKRAHTLELKLPFIQAVLSSYQYLTLRHRTLMEQGFGTKVFSYYGATDLGGSLIGVECSRGHMHVREDHVFLELRAPEHATGALGDLGMVTVTTLNNPWMPLVRYEVGDLARPAPPCWCEVASTWPCIRLEGRMKDLIFRPDGSPVTTREVDEVIGGRDLDFYRLTQEDERYTLEAIVAQGGSAERAKTRLSRLLGEDARLDVEEVRAFAPERSLKFRQTVSLSPGPPARW